MPLKSIVTEWNLRLNPLIFFHIANNWKYGSKYFREAI